MSVSEVTYPDVEVDASLVGSGDNVFAIIGTVAKAIRNAGHPDGAKAFVDGATHCHSYHEVLRFVRQTVEVV